MPRIGTPSHYLCRIKNNKDMLKYINENLQVGDFVEIETPDGTIGGCISTLQPDRLVLSVNGKEQPYPEEQLLGVRYVSEDLDAYTGCYIQKFFPSEKSERSIYAANHNNTLEIYSYDNVVQLFWGEEMHQLSGHIDLPDMVDVEDEYSFVEYIGEGLREYFSERLTSIRLPKCIKGVDTWCLEEAHLLKEVYVPNTLVDSGAYKVGGCDTCQVFDLNGKPVDWEFEPDW